MAEMNMDPIVLPIATVQPDFLSVISDVREGLVQAETFWLSCYKAGDPSVHGKVDATLDDVDRTLVRLEGREGVEMDHQREAYFAACPSLHLPRTRLAVAAKTYADAASSNPRRPSKITALDVAPDRTQFATGYHDGFVCIRSASATSAPPIFCKPHLSTVTSLRYFPSSRVLLTAGNDFSLSILPADPPNPSASSPSSPVSPARTLRGHSRSVTSTAIIARGRNLLSGSKDGTLRLWDVPSGEQIRMLMPGGGSHAPVLALSVGEQTSQLTINGANGDMDVDRDADAGLDPREVETADKVAFCGLQDGTYEAFDLRTKRSIFRSAAPTGGTAPIQAISYAPVHNLLATGSTSGLVSVYDVRFLHTPLTTFRRNTASVEDLAFVAMDASAFFIASPDGTTSRTHGEAPEVGLAIATEDGLPYVANVRPNGPSVRAELVGPDCDPVRAVRVIPGEDVWTAADDGVVRRYRIW